MKTAALLILATITSLFTFAQQGESIGFGKISGTIIDSLSGQPLEYATISLIKKGNNKVINGNVADSKGTFKLTEVPDGTYKVTINFIGFEPKEFNNIVIDKTSLNIALGDIRLLKKQNSLKEVTIVGTKGIIENQIDKMVYNVEKDVTSQSGVASDVLKKVPQVSVDVDGNVELQGSSSIRFLINGKPSVIFGSNIADVLQSIPASQIKSIEVITSPGAKYDASGTVGIINIILKKSTAEGYNGNISLTGGTRLENGSLNLNVHHKHFGANAFFSGNSQLPSTTLNSLNSTSHYSSPTETSQLAQSGQSKFSRNGFQSGVGFDWEATPLDNFSGSFGYNHFDNNNHGFYNRNSILSDSTGSLISDINDVVNTNNIFRLNSYNWGLDYKRKFKKEDQELDISYQGSTDNAYSHYDQAQSYVVPDSLYSGSYGNNPGTEKEMVLSADYTQPLGAGAALEAGAKMDLDKITSTSNVYLFTPPGSYIYSPTQSVILNYTNNVYAGYLSVKFKMANWLDVKTGLRYEYTDPQAFFSHSGDAGLKGYGTYVPSAVISHTFKDNQTLKLSYSHRIERPDYRSLDPFVNASDPKNLSTGNPGLRPEIGDKLELSYNKSFEKGASVNVTLFYRGNKDDIQSYTNYYSSYAVGDSVYNNVSVTTRENIGREDNYGLNIFASFPVTTKLNFRTNLAAFQRYINTGLPSGGNVQGFNYRANMNVSYAITPTFLTEVFGNFNSPRVNAQGKMLSFTTYNIALRKQFLKKKASLAITATNPFSKYVDQRTELAGTNFTSVSLRQLPYRSFGLNFTYKFGKLKFKKEKETEDINLNPPAGN